MNLEELEKTERESRPLHITSNKTALTIHTPAGHFLYLCGPDGNIERKRLDVPHGMGAVCD